MSGNNGADHTPFRASFPDVHMDTVELIAEDDTVIGRFTCTATHTGTWQGHPPTGRRFTNIDEVNLYRIHNGLITQHWTLEDNLERLTQLTPDGLKPLTRTGAP